jgi:UDP-N-acetylmuramoyl-L-alanyl-D-glutamate--2,6-diaminopimelate ligase
VRLRDLAASVDVIALRGDLDTEVTSMALDTRSLRPGVMFCCVPGGQVDGHDFAATAIQGGAVALVTQRRLDLGVPEVEVANVRMAIGPMAATLHGHPSDGMAVIGVTGTNGKTTTVELLRAIFEANGWRTGAIGTLARVSDGPVTTPDAPELQARLAELREQGHQAVAMEVSSHALAQGRVEGVHFAAAVFTNLSQDHLDYHDTMDAYFDAKALLFDSTRSRVAIVNADDPWGQKLLQRLEGTDTEVHRYRVSDVKIEGTAFAWQGRSVRMHLFGRTNVSNALAAATTAQALGIDDETIVQGLESVGSIVGRFELVDEGQNFVVLVDYAHTPDALREALSSARAATDGRVILVFGCGGDRDAGKRPKMGRIAAEMADRAIVTNDNPRSEDPDAIVDAVVAGDPDGRLLVETDRAAAIAMAVDDAAAGDVVLIAGKGHETGQQFADHTDPFDDHDVARAALRRRKDTGGW